MIGLTCVRLQKMRRFILSAIVTVTIPCILVSPPRSRSQTATPDYKNPQLSVDQRVADLLKRMTIEEKVAQLVCLWQQRPQVAPQTDFSTDRGGVSSEKAAQVMKYGIGQIARQRERKGPREGAEFANAVQKWLIENTRLGIPARTVE